MLSRVAYSIYWMCRYVERAENIARFINVNLNLLLDIPSGNGSQWTPLVMTTGDQRRFEEKYGEDYSKKNVVEFLTFDRDYPNSILSCLKWARENARCSREIISTETWEHLNNFYLELAGPKAPAMAADDPHRFFRIIQMRSHLFSGLLDATMSHGEAWNFSRLALMLERADKTSRILDVKYFMLLPQVDLVDTPFDNIQWAAVLKSTSAFEMYRKKHHHISPTKVADFLIFDKYFPRSVRHCIYDAQIDLHRITETPIGSGGSRAEKKLGRLMAEIEYTDIQEVIQMGMHEYLDSLQTRLNELDDAIGCTFFNLKPVKEEAPVGQQQSRDASTGLQQQTME